MYPKSVERKIFLPPGCIDKIFLHLPNIARAFNKRAKHAGSSRNKSTLIPISVTWILMSMFHENEKYFRRTTQFWRGRSPLPSRHRFLALARFLPFLPLSSRYIHTKYYFTKARVWKSRRGLSVSRDRIPNSVFRRN